MAEKHEEGQDPFSGVTVTPIDDEVRRQIGARRRSREEREREKELERLRQQQETRRAKRREKDKERQRVHYDWPKWLIKAVERIAVREGISRSQAAAFLMRLAIHAYERGTVDMGPYKQPSRIPRWDWELEIPDDGDGILDLTR